MDEDLKFAQIIPRKRSMSNPDHFIKAQTIQAESHDVRAAAVDATNLCTNKPEELGLQRPSEAAVTAAVILLSSE